MLDLVFNLKFLKQDIGVSIVRRSPAILANKNINVINRVGADGDLYEDLGGRKDIIIPVECNFISDNPKEVFRRVKHWLNNIEDNKLIFTDDPGWFYKVVNVEIGQMEVKFKRKGEFTINFTCRGWQYSLDGDEFLEIENNTMLYNEYDLAKPLLYLEGNGEITITINNNSFSVMLRDFLYIDSELEIAYREKTDCLNIETGDYPLLEYGENNISFTGNVNKVEIKPRWREV
ncbi:distal tail protein Dit [Clostridium perfringens]|uniref:distal tail protein Dit n=1 Tax=Clostridium perfringens TaxID=1502 RepID=UPI00232AAD33|nr:distal tail protein Dit [Clostridium perfringens]MDB2043042.1 phage tail family protein [Clostridium perfringens]MDB2053597.1 phage tail family protein [Clostridium perfringens]MDM0676246.1 phage tail family protein [Clostridium perfringens]MDM0679217.1 phage tail family protein [Clostridium perfringens]MDM0682159.1 phage tail family protein [Clostridium perfringens]